MRKRFMALSLLALFAGGFVVGRSVSLGRGEGERKARWASVVGRSPLEADERLGRPVTVKVRRLPLRLFLGRISRDCGVRLDISRPLFKEFPEVVAVVRGRPAREVLEALSCIYWARWERAGRGYILVPLEEFGWEGIFARLWEGAKAFSSEKMAERGIVYAIQEAHKVARWAAKFVPPQWREALATTGVPVSCLPLHVRRRLYQAHVASQYMRQLGLMVKAGRLRAYLEGSLRLSPKEPNVIELVPKGGGRPLKVFVPALPPMGWPSPGKIARPSPGS